MHIGMCCFEAIKGLMGNIYTSLVQTAQTEIEWRLCAQFYNVNPVCAKSLQFGAQC